MSGFCRWYGKDMEDVTEHEQEQCEEKGEINVERTETKKQKLTE
jgi:hypothetical protein